MSAYSGKERPRYQAMLQAIAGRRLDAVVVYHLDRLHRLPRELEEFFQVTEKAGVFSFASCSGDIDLATPEGQLMARIQGAVAAKESADKSRRIKRKHEELALAGKWSGGGRRRAYGYTNGLSQVIPDEAAIIREMAKRALAGDSVSAIATDLKERRVPTATGSNWTETTIRQILTAARISGRREHHGEIIAEGQWEPIISFEDSDCLRRKLRDPARRTGGDGRTPRRYPLIGLLYCDLCGAKLVSRPSRDQRRYICPKNGGRTGCGGVAILAEPVENFIAAAVLYRLDTPELQRRLADELRRDEQTAALHESAEADQAQLEELAGYADKLLTLAEFLTARKIIEQRLNETKAAIAMFSSRPAIEPYVGHAEALREQWADLHPSRQKAIIAALLDRVYVKRAERRGAPFNSERLRALWRV